MNKIFSIDNHAGAIMLVASAAVFTADVTVLRFLSHDVPFTLIIFFRSISQLLIISIWIFFLPKIPFFSSRWKMLISRGITSLICWWLYYLSFKKLDLALASTLTFTSSLFAVVLAPFFLKEKMGLKKSLITILGFIGILVASEITNLKVEIGILLGLGSAIAAAILMIQNRLLVNTEHTATIMFWIGLVATLGTLPGTFLSWTNVAMQDFFILSIAGVLGTIGMLLTVEAFRFGEVSSLAPYPYTRIIFALLIGYFLFGELITFYQFIGAIIIIVCSLFAGKKNVKSL